jgi:hypothetical protein
MQTGLNQIQNQGEVVDSIGSIYHISSANNPLDTQFLQLKYINYSQKVEPVKASESGSQNQSNGTFLSFAYSDFLLISLILLFGLVVFVKIQGKNYMNRILMSVQNYSYSISFFKEKNLAYVLYNNIMTFVFYISSGLLASIIAKYYGIDIPDNDKILEFVIITAIVTGFIVLNRFITRLCGIAFGFYRLAGEYLFYYANLLRLVGILFMVLVLVLSFISLKNQTFFIYFSFFIIGIVCLVKSLRIFVIFLSNRLSLYYLILYFCALEIIPVILLIKLINLVIKNNYSF